MGTDLPLADDPPERWSPIVELRRYTLRTAMRDTLVDLFDGHLVETQEQTGMKVIGQFRDLDDDDAFVWLRGFPDMEARARSLAAFYGGPVWAEHRDAANATMIDSDDVLLLHPTASGSGFVLRTERPPTGGSGEVDDGVIEATILHLQPGATDEAVGWFEREIAPAAGPSLLAHFVTETAENTFPMLPVREGEHVLVWFSAYPDRATYEREAPVSAHGAHRAMQAPGLRLPPQTLRLSPTSRSLLTGSAGRRRRGA